MDPMIVKGLIGIAPVIVCLVAFEWIDAFKLLGLRDVVGLMAVGAFLATGGYYANGGVMDRFPIGVDAYTSYVAPLAEEGLKCACVVVLFALNRIGYLIDAAIAGFAVGSGFALAENLFFLHQFTGANIGVWVVRGFGTAIMHGGATALFAVLSMALYAPRLRMSVERFHFNPLLFAPGFAAAVVMHGVFNHFQHAPLLAMAVVMLAVPLSLFAVFSIGETYAHRWLVEDRAAHVRLLEDLRSGAFAQTTGGRALEALATRMGPLGAADLFDYVRTNTELVVRADETLLAIEDHEKVALDIVVRGRFEHLHNLEKRLGQTALLAVRQHLHVSRDDLWKLHQLEADSVRKGFRS
jgi:RsiW-degrading membrane proteinase PrsW (M82 family)